MATEHQNGTHRNGSGSNGNGNGRVRAQVVLVDRSHLLRRTHRAEQTQDDTGIRLRRERRVNGPFSAVPSLARDQTR